MKPLAGKPASGAHSGVPWASADCRPPNPAPRKQLPARSLLGQEPPGESVSGSAAPGDVYALAPETALQGAVPAWGHPATGQWLLLPPAFTRISLESHGRRTPGRGLAASAAGKVGKGHTSAPPRSPARPTGPGDSGAAPPLLPPGLGAAPRVRGFLPAGPPGCTVWWVQWRWPSP